MLNDWWGRLDHHWRTLPRQHRRVVAAILWLFGTLPFLSRLHAARAALDLAVYYAGAEAVSHGVRVYREVPFEYPPYALLWFLAPYAGADDADGFRVTFGLEIWCVDAALKAMLLWLGMREHRGLRGLAPFVAYTLGTAALGHLLLQRFDVIPAALSVVAILALSSGWAFLAGFVTMVGAGTKLYPLLLLPLFLLLATRRGSAGRFLAGTAAGVAPLLLVAPWVPWWTFASYHTARGLQAESLSASVLWALHFVGLPATWQYVEASKAREVTGAIAASLAGPARALWLLVTVFLVGAALSALRTVSRHEPPSAAWVAALALLPLAGFVSLNTVLSPQYHLWLLPLAALVLASSSDAEGQADAAAWMRRGAGLIILATLTVPTFYPSREHEFGLGLWRTSMLLLRNGMLLWATYCLWRGCAALRAQPVEALVLAGDVR